MDDHEREKKVPVIHYVVGNHLSKSAPILISSGLSTAQRYILTLSCTVSIMSIIETKTFTENQNGQRHLLDLPWWYGFKKKFFWSKTFVF